jgi:MFS family permease
MVKKMIYDFIRRNSLPSLIFLFGLIMLNGIGVTLPIPNMTLIAQQLNFQYVGLIEALFILISMCSLIFWGYLVDNMNRKTLLLIANISWLIPSSIIFFFPSSLFAYVFGRLGMAFGLSAFSPLSYSILADYAEYEERGLVSAGLNLAWIGSSAAGIILGAIFTTNWYNAFGTLAILGGILFCWQFWIKIPERGRKEPAFTSLSEYNYHWKIDLSMIPNIFKSQSMRWLLIQGSFALIPGTIFTYWLVSFLASTEGLSLSIELASIVAITIASGRAPGYLFFGYFGDCLSKNEKSSIRAKLAAIGMVLQAIFFFGSFLVLNSSIITILLFSILFWCGSFIGAASGPNRTALLFNISLPESRGTLGSLYSLTDHLGAAFGLFISTVFLQVFNFHLVFLTSLFFYLLAAISWYRSTYYLDSDQTKIHDIMTQRASILLAN